VNPALAIGRALGDERTAYLYVGVRGRAEADVVPREGIPIKFVRASAYPGARPSLAWPGFLFNVFVGTLRALFVVRAFKPEVIVGTGGYASAPTMFAAAILRRLGLLSARVYVHEQNAAPGKLNLLVGRLADRVFVSFADTLASFPANGTMAGYPLRRRIPSKPSRQTPRERQNPRDEPAVDWRRRAYAEPRSSPRPEPGGSPSSGRPGRQHAAATGGGSRRWPPRDCPICRHSGRRECWACRSW